MGDFISTFLHDFSSMSHPTQNPICFPAVGAGSASQTIPRSWFSVVRSAGSLFRNFTRNNSPLPYGDPKLKTPFEVYLVDWYLHRVYDELNGLLSDDIGPIPEA